MPGLFLAVDQGSTSTRCVAYDDQLGTHGRASCPVATNFPGPGRVEQDPQELLDSVVGCMRRAADAAGASLSEVSGVGLAAQTETFVLWDRQTGAALSPAVSWRDVRAAGYCGALKGDGHEDWIRARSGLPVTSAFSAPKLTVLLRDPEYAAVRERLGNVLFGDVNSWLVWNLTGGALHVTDASMATRTMLYDPVARRWDDSLLELFEVERRMLPAVCPTFGRLGQTDERLLGSAVPIVAVIGDQQAALYGHGCWRPGTVKLTLGTGAFLWANAGDAPVDQAPPGVIRSVAWDSPAGRVFADEGFVPNAGSVVSWLRSAGLLGKTQWPSIRPGAVTRSEGPWCVPALSGFGAPSWDPRPGVHFLGLLADTTSRELAEAALVGVAHQVADAYEAMRLPRGGEHIRVDGGMAANTSLLQAIADLASVPLARAGDLEATTAGVAMLGGLALEWPAAGREPGMSGREIIGPSPSLDRGSCVVARERWSDLVTGLGSMRALR